MEMLKLGTSETYFWVSGKTTPSQCIFMKDKVDCSVDKRDNDTQHCNYIHGQTHSDLKETKKRTICFNAIHKIRRKLNKMWEYQSKIQSTNQLLGRMHLGVDRKRSTDKKLKKKKEASHKVQKVNIYISKSLKHQYSIKIPSVVFFSSCGQLTLICLTFSFYELIKYSIIRTCNIPLFQTHWHTYTHYVPEILASRERICQKKSHFRCSSDCPSETLHIQKSQ